MVTEHLPKPQVHIESCNETKKKYIFIIKLEVLVAVVINADVNRRFGGTYHLHIKGGKSVQQETRALSGG
jgi:hypothetical protein